MSKVDELKLKYETVNVRTFNKLTEADKTPTKKYLEFLLKSWSLRGYNDCPSTTDALIGLVNKFDELLPYIENKDIYSKDYTNLSLLKKTITRAEEVKDEKTFIRDEHVIVLHETDKYLLLTPTTHKGSLKYGSRTKWCTASKADVGTFQRYTRNGLLGYVIDKSNERQLNYNKIALYHEYSDSAFSGEVRVFNSCDNETIFWYFRAFFTHMRKTKKSKDFVERFTTTLGTLDFKSLSEHVKVLEQMRNTAYISKLEETITNLYKNLNNQEYARFTKTEN
jgi:hypothetical protein